MSGRPGAVRRAQEAVRRGGDTRALKREAAAGNPYVRWFLDARGLAYDPASGAIRRVKFPPEK